MALSIAASRKDVSGAAPPVDPQAHNSHDAKLEKTPLKTNLDII
jgi:hypothetical protein